MPDYSVFLQSFTQSVAGGILIDARAPYGPT